MICLQSIIINEDVSWQSAFPSFIEEKDEQSTYSLYTGLKNLLTLPEDINKMKDYNDVVPFSFIFLQVEKCDWAIDAAYTNDLPLVFSRNKI